MAETKVTGYKTRTRLSSKKLIKYRRTDSLRSHAVQMPNYGPEANANFNVSSFERLRGV
jgi:hypothetical protein